MNVSLQVLKSAGVEGIMMDVWWGLVEKERLDRTIGVGMDRWRLVGFLVDIGGLPMSSMMVSLKITDNGLDVE